MEEVWELFSLEDNDANMSQEDTHSELQLYMVISADAISGKEGPKTLQLLGTLQGITIQILVDSGITNSFISEQVFRQLSDLSVQPVDVQVKVANGGLMQCSALVPDCSWTMQGHSFSQESFISSVL